MRALVKNVRARANEHPLKFCEHYDILRNHSWLLFWVSKAQRHVLLKKGAFTYKQTKIDAIPCYEMLELKKLSKHTQNHQNLARRNHFPTVLISKRFPVDPHPWTPQKVVGQAYNSFKSWPHTCLLKVDIHVATESQWWTIKDKSIYFHHMLHVAWFLCNENGICYTVDLMWQIYM